jgi:alkylation response protein AidB-like acyl-CoA dehydrogenase
VIAFELPDDVADLCDAAARFAEQRLRPALRDAERAGRWSDDVLRVLDDFSLRDIDRTAGRVAKVALLETLARGDAGGLPAADQPGRSSIAFAIGAGTGMVDDVLDACLTGVAQAPLVVLDGDAIAVTPRIEWAPSWPPLRWAWVTHGETLRLVEIAAEPEPIEALAFHASGGVSASLEDQPVLGEWTLSMHDAIGLRGWSRLWLAAVAVGVAQDALDATLADTTERVVFGKPVAYHQGNAFELAGLATNLHGARLAVRDAAARYDGRDRFAGFWATQAWMTAVDTAIAVTDAGVQLLGGHGFLVDHVAEKRFREARMLGLLSGGRDAAEADVAALVLEAPDPLFA